MATTHKFRIRFQAPLLPRLDQIAKYYSLAEQARWYSNGGPCLALLQARLEEYLGGAMHAVPVSNATAGLMVAIRALTGGRRDRRYVITPSFTFVATASAIDWAGFEPIFVDVDPSGWHADPESIRRALERFGDEVALLLPCSTFGFPVSIATVQAWRGLAQEAGVPLLIDAAAGFGGLRDDQIVTSDGDATVYSFHATKPFAIGEGGLVVTADGDLAPRLRQVLNFGFDSSRRVTGSLGLNAKLDELHASVALATLDDYDVAVAARRSIARHMSKQLTGAGFEPQATGGGSPPYQFFPCLAPSSQIRADCLKAAERERIEVRTYYDTPLHEFPALHDAPTADDLTTTRELASRCLSLPMATDMSIPVADEVVRCMLRAAQGP